MRTLWRSERHHAKKRPPTKARRIGRRPRRPVARSETRAEAILRSGRRGAR